MAAEEYSDVEEPILLDEEEEEMDTAIAMTSALVFATFAVMILAHIVAQQALGTLFKKGLLA